MGNIRGRNVKIFPRYPCNIGVEMVKFKLCKYHYPYVHPAVRMGTGDTGAAASRSYGGGAAADFIRGAASERRSARGREVKNPKEHNMLALPKARPV